MTAYKDIGDIAELLKSEAYRIYEDMGLKASGDFGRSLKAKVIGVTKIELYGALQFDMMTRGRARNSDQSKEAIRAFVGGAGHGSIGEWVKDKGLNINPFAVAYKIAREGVKVPNKHNDGTYLKKLSNSKAIDDAINDYLQYIEINLE